MANKIPVGRSIAGAYGFAFGNIVNNIGVIWIPLAILYVFGFLYQSAYLNAAAGATSSDPQAAIRFLPLFFGFMLVMLVLFASVYAGLTKEALGRRTGGAFLQFPFGADTWRLIGANILLFLVMCVVYLVCVLATLLITLLTAAVLGNSQSNPLAAGLVAGVLGLVVLCAVIYIATRLSFLLAPVTIAEKRISLIRAWQLTQGSFWRIFVVMLVVLIPLIVGEAIFFAVFFKGMFDGFHAGMTPDEMVQMQQHQMALSRSLVETQTRYWFIAIPLGFLFTAITYGLLAGAGAVAYKAVVPSDGSAEAEAMS